MKAREAQHLLILGGTAEARALADAAHARFAERLSITTSLAGRTSTPAEPKGGLRRGGFGGAAGLADYLAAAQVDLVIDATHPFATQITAAAQAACRQRDLPLLALARPRWTAQSGDRWIEAADAAEAASILPKLGRRAFLTIGQRGIAAFAHLSAMHFLVRLIEPPPTALPLRSYEILLGRGPFTLEDERRIIESHAIEALVAKASGGDATAAKLEAARLLRIPVVMLRRPQPLGTSVASVEDALCWIAHKVEDS
ncbi:MAG: cobalt-precorrin-6A reductase [Stellaceae bacterium]